MKIELVIESLEWQRNSLKNDMKRFKEEVVALDYAIKVLEDKQIEDWEV